MRFPKPRVLARWAILSLLLSMGGSPEVCLLTDPNDIGYLGDSIFGRGIISGPHSQWTPDGRHIIFVDGGEIYRVTPDGSDLQLILESAGPDEVFYSPRISPDGTRIVYMTTRHEVSREKTEESSANRRNFEIETSLLDGTNRRRLTENFMQDTSPVWSPDGSRIAFMRIYPGGWPPGNPGIYTMAADGSDQRLILPREPINYDLFPNIRFGGYWDDRVGTFVLQQRVPNQEMIDSDEPADSSAATNDPVPTVLTTDFSYFGGPVWSPNGDKIAFIGSIEYIQMTKDDLKELASTSTPLALYTMNTDGSDLTPVLTPPLHDDDNYGINIDRPGWPLAWSPDAKRIAFLGYFYPEFYERQSETRRLDWLPGLGLYEIGIDGSDLRAIAAINIDALGLRGLVTIQSEQGDTDERPWSTDGISLLLPTIAGRPFSGETPVVRAEGSVPRIDAPLLDASFSPDGSMIAVSDGRGYQVDVLSAVDRLYTMAPDGSDIQVIVERDEDGELRAVNQVEKNCFLLVFCG